MFIFNDYTFSLRNPCNLKKLQGFVNLSEYCFGMVIVDIQLFNSQKAYGKVCHL